MNLNHREIELLLSEIPLEGSIFQKIYQHSASSFTFSMYSKEAGRYLLHMSVSPASSYFFITEKIRKRSEKAQRFTEFMRKHIVGKRIVSVEKIPFDRIFILKLRNSEGVLLMTVRMFSGSGANIIITDENMKILDLLYRRPGRNEITGETLLIGEGKTDSGFTVRNWSAGSFNEFIEKTIDSSSNSKSPVEILIKKRDEELLMLQKRLSSLRKKAKNSSGYDSYLNTANLLCSVIHSVKKGMEEIRVECGDESVLIPLDRTLSPSENLEAYYSRYKKMKGAYDDAVSEAEETEKRIKKTEEKYALLIESGETEPIEKEIRKSETRKSIGTGLTIESSGFTILVGRNAGESDEILRKHTRGSDIWMHTRDYPGGFVIIKAQKGRTPPLPVILDAASLAIHFSKAKKTGEADLYYTEVKNVRRVRGGKPGKVLVYNEKNLRAEADEKRLKELLFDA